MSFVSFREMPKRIKVARVALKTLAPFGITKDILREDRDHGASQHQTSGWLYEPQKPPLSTALATQIN